MIGEPMLTIAFVVAIVCGIGGQYVVARGSVRLGYLMLLTALAADVALCLHYLVVMAATLNPLALLMTAMWAYFAWRTLQTIQRT